MNAGHRPAEDSSASRAPAELEVVSGRRFAIHLHLMAEPCLWCWEVRDLVHGQLIKSSWANEWTAYDSAEEARLAAELQVTELDRLSSTESFCNDALSTRMTPDRGREAPAGGPRLRSHGQ